MRNQFICGYFLTAALVFTIPKFRIPVLWDNDFDTGYSFT